MSYANGYGTSNTQTAVMRPHGHSEFYDLEQADEALSSRVEDLEQDRDAIRRELSELAETIEEHEGTGDEHADLIEELTERVTWLEGVVAAAGLVAVADFETFTDEDARLAKAARLGREAAMQLLTDHQRAMKTAVIEHLARRQNDYQEALSKATAAALVLGETGLDDPQHAAVRAAYRKARTALPAPVADHERQRAADAADELAGDDIARQELGAVVRRGEAAGRELLTRTRTRVVEALGRSLMMPPWFATHIGRTAPRRNPDRWITTAAEVLIYRLTYKLTDDQVRPLGPRPSREQDPARHEFFIRLTGLLGIKG